jgi:hypothetical protein
MLQQTRVEAVKPYFDRFIRELPDVKALAECEEDKLLKLWEGLGYYNRVRNLKIAANQILEEYDGVIPSEYEELMKLKGIGSYTAGAIASIAYGKPVPAVDGNVLRVLAAQVNEAGVGIDAQDGLVAGHNELLVELARDQMGRATAELTASGRLRPVSTDHALELIGRDEIPIIGMHLHLQVGNDLQVVLRSVRILQHCDKKLLAIQVDGNV